MLQSSTGSQVQAHTVGGFSLVEIILALAVVSIGMVGILALFPLGLDATRQATDATEAATIASEQITYYQQATLNSINYIGSPIIDSITTNIAGCFYTIVISGTVTSCSPLICTNSVTTYSVSKKPALYTLPNDLYTNVAYSAGLGNRTNGIPYYFSITVTNAGFPTIGYDELWKVEYHVEITNPYAACILDTLGHPGSTGSQYSLTNTHTIHNYAETRVNIAIWRRGGDTNYYVTEASRYDLH